MSAVVETATAASGLLFLILAGFVASVRPRTLANLAFAGYAGSYGLYFLLYGAAVAWASDWAQVPWPVHAVLALCVWAITPTLALLAVSAPRPLGRNERLSLQVSLLVTIAFALIFLAGYLSTELGPAANLEMAGVSLAIATTTGATLLLTMRFHAAGPEDGELRFVTALLAASLLLQQGMWAGEGIMGNVGYRPGLLVFAANILFGFGWLWVMMRGGGRIARRVAWTALGSMVAGMSIGLVLNAQGAAGFAVARAVAAVVIAYAILRHQLLGIEVKVRWGISRGTIAAVFIAVFFVASEGAQILFGSENPWVGLLAAGLLVFAIAPLQRAAERLAEKAVPGDAPSRRVESAEWLYRVALESAMGNGPPTREDEQRLARLAHELGLSSMEALAVRHALEDESHGRGEGA